MKNKRRVEIEIEEHEITVIRFNRKHSAMRFCQFCRSNVRHLPVSTVAKLLQISELSVFSLVEGKRVHSSETESGALLVCRRSLIDLLDANPDALSKK